MMNNTDVVFTKLLKAIEDVAFCSLRGVDENTNLIKHFDFDDVDVIVLLAHFDILFKIDIPDERVQILTDAGLTVSDLYAQVKYSMVHHHVDEVPTWKTEKFEEMQEARRSATKRYKN
jgi:acyl carrier protein